MAVTELAAKQLQELQDMKASLRALVEGLDPDAVFVFDAPALWDELDELARLASAGATLLARRVEEACTWRSEGFRSAAEQLASRSGTSIASARSLLETSRQVAELSDTAEVLRTGQLSVPKAALVAGAAVVAPDAEAQLLETAVRAPLREVRDKCLRARAGVDREAAHARIRRERCLKEYTDAEGAWNLHARGTPEAGMVVRAALERLVDARFPTTDTDACEPREAYAFDALVQLAEHCTGATDVGGKTTRKPLALVRVDHEALRRGAVEGDEVCEISGLGPVPVGVARDLLGDAVVKLVITKGVDVVNVTHLGRSATVAQRVALWWRSPICDVEGCTRTQRLEIDHREGWARTHQTEVKKLDRLCDHHHDLKTYAGWVLVEGIGRRPMVPPDDPRHPNSRPPPGA